MERWKNHILASILSLLVLFLSGADFSPAENIKYNVVHSWADKLGMELFHLGDFITRRKEVQNSFNKDTHVIERNGEKIVENMANEIKMMMDLKVSAVRRIMDTSENTALSHQNDPLDVRFPYYNAKQMVEPGEPLPTEAPPDLEDVGVERIEVPPKEIILNPKAEFFNTRVNLSHSSVHIPTNVFDRAVEVIQAIKWSEHLDTTFKDNYKNDPTLSWQFYGSSTGFMRQFPASKWKQDPVDLYDCRLRSWYIEAATSPKDIVILMDGSGSMNGQRLDIAKHVVETILDTLGANDFVNIFTFGMEVKPVVSCFEDTLVQGTLDNIRELKESTFKINKTFAIANFTAALVKAFEVLELFRTEGRGANCNQAIMLISDGAPFSYEEIFEQYNWQNKGFMPVRVFTYLIGKEVADVKEIKWMACENRGYYVHLSDLAEVREMVLNYIPVMARPLVLGRHDHPVIWTQVYADEVDPKMTDWLWEVKQCEEQKSDIENFRANGYKIFHRDEEERRYWSRRKKSWIQPLESDKYHFMTTVSMPVYDRRENATRIANLLGVAGTDVPIRDIRKLLSPFLLGVNGYAFIVTNNGYILFHPDFRPIFQDILKPAYNSVDMIEVELLDDGREPRNFNPMLIGIREDIINQTTGSKWMKVKNHFDEMKRVTRLRRYYFWTPVQNTPFTLVITYPEQYGVNRLQIRADDDIHRISIKGKNTANFFSGKKWKIHPDWLFCKHSNYNNTMTFTSPEAELLHFLDKMSKPGWKWPLSRSSLPPEHTAAMYSNTSSGRLPSLTEKESYYCDRNLMQSLVFDARATEWFSNNSSFNTKDDTNKVNEFKQRFGVTVAFLATHSGLTRWHEFHSNMAEEAHSGEQFGENNRHAIDEVWYKRAVDQHFVRKDSFVYSVPFDSGETNADILVTASHAIFKTEGNRSAPAAVVGYQFQHRALYTLFKNITSNCVDCPKTCTSEELDCYILDNNGYIVISPRRTETGKFFGDVNGALMRRLIEERVYQEVIIYDYQAVCFAKIDENNSSSKLFSPLMHILRLAKWLVHTLLWYIVQFHTVAADVMEHYTDDNLTYYAVNTKDWVHRVTLRRTRLKSCDHRRHLYTLYNETENVVYNMTAHACERPFVVLPIPESNLILLVLDVMCPKESAFRLTVDPLEIQYDYPENYTLSCYKRDRELLRIRPGSCINRHMNESEIKLCGDANIKLVNYILILFSVILIRYL